MNRSLTILIGSVVVVAAACGASGPEAGSSVHEIVMEEMRFVPNRIEARVGETQTIKLINHGSQVHDMMFPALHMPGLEGAEAIVEPGESMSLTLRFGAPGVHRFICSLPGHAAMTGAVYVSP